MNKEDNKIQVFTDVYKEYKIPYFKDEVHTIAKVKVPEILKQHPYILGAMELYAKQKQVEVWIDVRDRTPKDNSHYMVCFKRDKVELSVCIDLCSYENGYWYSKDVFRTGTKDITHWMETPKPPLK